MPPNDYKIIITNIKFASNQKMQNAVHGLYPWIIFFIFSSLYNILVVKYSKKKRQPIGRLFLFMFADYCEIAPVGQTPAHVPQSRHASASITY